MGVRWSGKSKASHQLTRYASWLSAGRCGLAMRLGDAADFGAAEIAAVLFLGELHQEELEPVLAKMRVVSPLRAASAPERGGQSSG